MAPLSHRIIAWCVCKQLPMHDVDKRATLILLLILRVSSQNTRTRRENVCQRRNTVTRSLAHARTITRKPHH
eukprot:EC797789.1.p5 GENE.EC797789.1~~EC797789.1.p5  ORF type:complete len:72 (-),score=24.03 EC797789.1:5-220(-)